MHFCGFLSLATIAAFTGLGVAAPATATDSPTPLDTVDPFTRMANLTSSANVALVKRELPPRDEMLYVAWDKYGGWAEANRNCWLKHQHMPKLDLVSLTVGGYCADFWHTSWWERDVIDPCVSKELKVTGETSDDIFKRMCQWLDNVCGWDLSK